MAEDADMRFNQLEYALEIMKTQSLSKASKNLFITKTALSESIIQLEKELGFIIFTRSRVGMHPTEAGKSFLKDAYEILKIASSWENLKKTEEVTEELKIAISYAIFPMVSDLMEKILIEQNNLSLNLNEYGAGEVLQVLPKNKNMIAILSVAATISWPSFVEFEKTNPGWKIEDLGEDEFVLAIGKNNSVADKDIITLDEVNELKGSINMVLLSWDKNALLNKLKCCAGDVSLTLTNREKIISMVSAGSAISLFPERVMKFEMQTNNQLDYVKVDADDMKIKYFMIYNMMSQMTEQKRYVLNSLKNCFETF